MKVIIEENYITEFGYERQNSWNLYTDNGISIGVCELNECPEDATFGRDLSFVFSIPELIQKAYDAGKNGESLDFEYKTEED